MKERWLKIGKIVLKIGFTISILYYLIKNGSLDFKLFSKFLDHPIILASLIFVLMCLIIPLASIRWWLFLKGSKIYISLKQTFYLTWIGNLFNTILPGAVSGDVVKGYYLRKLNQDSTKTVLITTLLMDRFVGLFGLIILSFGVVTYKFFFAQVINVTLSSLFYPISLLALGTFIFYGIVLIPFKLNKDPIVLVLSKIPFLGKYLIQLYLAFKKYRDQYFILSITLFISLVIHFSTMSLIYLISTVVIEYPPNYFDQMLIIPIGLTSTTIPIAPGGIGIGHVAFDKLYGLLKVQGGANIFNLYIVVQLSIYLCGIFPYLSFKGNTKKK